MSVRELPFAFEYLGPWTVEANHVVPACRDRETVGNLAVTAAELDGYRPVGIAGDVTGGLRERRLLSVRAPSVAAGMR